MTPEINIENFKKILIVKPSSLGDVVHSLPFLYALKKKFPKAEIHWIIAKGLEELLENNLLISKTWIIDKDKWQRISSLSNTLRSLYNLRKNLRKERFDIAIDLQGLLRSGLLAYASGACVRLGFKEAREGASLFYTHKIKGGRDIHAVDRYLKIASFLGCDIKNIESPILKVSNAFQNKIDYEYVVIAPGARWKTKRWHPELFGELASKLNIKSIVVGSNSDVEIADNVVNNSKGNAVSLAGKTSLKELINVISKAKFVITNDSGPMHIASALNIPVFSIFGPTNPMRTGPYGKGHTVLQAKIDCSPCYKKLCKSTKCMDSISVEEVFNAIKEKL
jgi:heptosyltransferase-1